MNRIVACVLGLTLISSSGVAVESDTAKLAPLLEDSVPWPKQRETIQQKWREYLGEFPKDRTPLKIQVLTTEDLPSFTRQFIKYQIEEGVFADGYLLTPKDATGKLPALVVFHATVATQAKQPAGVDTANPELMIGVQLVQRGYVVLCPRCFIFGEGGNYTEQVAAMQARHPTWRGMTRMTFDAVRAADVLASLPNVDARRLGCIGHSLGAKEALYAAAFDDRYKAAVFSEGGIGMRFSNWDAVWYLGPGINQPGFALKHHQLLAMIAPRAFLLLAGESADGDKSGAFIEAARRVYSLLGATENLDWLNHRQGHRYPPDAQAKALAFLNEHLRRD